MDLLFSTINVLERRSFLSKLFCSGAYRARRIHAKCKMGINDRRARFRFINRDDPNYQKPQNTHPYTQRQRDILAGDIPFEEIKTQELTPLIEKTVPNTSNKHSAISGYSWSGDNRNVTYQNIP